MRASSADANWKSGNHDARRILPGETLTVADVDGPGVIHHIWFTFFAPLRFGRLVTIRMYWDCQDEPAVEAPVGDFFAVGHGARRQVDSLPVSVSSEGRAFNCYWSMPFAKHARITLSNDSRESKVSVYWYVDYERVESLASNAAYFHAQYRQEFPARAGNYLVLDAEGQGHYVGTVLSAYSRTKGWFGEGDDFFYIDGETEPSLRGTGTEDYFCDAWGFRELNRPYYGIVIFDGFDAGDRISVYRWHIQDPVRFTRSLKVEIEHKGVMYDDKSGIVSYFHERPDLFSSVAFWYQTGKAKRFTTLPPVDERLVPITLVELEQARETARTSPAGVLLKPAQGDLFSEGRQLLAHFATADGALEVPFTLASRAYGIARLRLVACPQGGAWSVSLDGQVVPGAVDLYSPAPAIRELRIGMVDLKPGEHTLSFRCKGHNLSSSDYYLGADAFSVEQIEPFAVPATAPAK